MQNATPRLVKMLSGKYGELSAERVEWDMKEHHGLGLSSHYIQQVSRAIGEVMREKEGEWTYSLPEMRKKVATISIGRDGTTTAIRGEGYKQTMAGTIAFYDKKGNRMSTLYLGCAPEKKKEAFDALLKREIDLVKKQYPKAHYAGVADGALDNWTFLNPVTDVQILDFFHGADYLKKFADIPSIALSDPKQKSTFQEQQRETLKDKKGGVHKVIKTLKEHASALTNQHDKDQARTIIGYFNNNKERMDYYTYQKKGYPIGSGVTEAACKTLVKQRLSQSGMRWNRTGVDDVLLTRGLLLSEGRWKQFWNKVTQFGYN